MKFAYSILKKILFLLPPELAHTLSLRCLNLLYRLGLLRPTHFGMDAKCKVIMGIRFPNPVGLAAGLDKNGEYIDALAALGFGFIEVGTVTPRPQPGNPMPRLFRLTAEQALINRMGFNNQGVDYLISQLKRTHYKGILGINIGKNKDTPIENAVDDYLICMKKVYSYASYLVINISSPNTPGLRTLQQNELLKPLLIRLKEEQSQLVNQFNKYVPLLVKIAPDLTDEEVIDMALMFKECEVDGIIATNTSLSREGVVNHPLQQEQGGLSGQPIFNQATHVLNQCHKTLNNRLPLIGVGGIVSAEEAKKKFQAGAHLVQIYTGFIYQGPKLIQEIIRHCSW